MDSDGGGKCGVAGAGVVFYPSSPNSSVQLSAYDARGALSDIPALLLPQPPASAASSQASLLIPPPRPGGLPYLCWLDPYGKLGYP